MTAISKSQFAEIVSRPRKYTEATYVDGTVFRFQSWRESDATEYELGLQDPKLGGINLKSIACSRRLMIAITLVDGDGNRLVDNEKQLETLDKHLADWLHEKCQSVNDYKKSDVEDLIKNSEPVEG